MRITIMTVGSRGDVQPCIALGRGLRAAGHEVRLATHALFEPWVREHGLDFGEIPGNPFAGMNALSAAAPPAPGRAAAPEQPFRARAAQALEEWMAGGLRAARDADAIVFSQLCFVGYDVAERLGVPSLTANFSPATPTGAFPSIYGPGLLRLGGRYNRLTHALDRQQFWQGVRPLVNRARARALGLPPLPLWGPYRRMRRERHPVLYAYSPSVLPRPDDWDAWVHVTGYWFLDQGGWSPPPELEAFLAAGPPPVYLGLGSVANSNPARVTGAALAALARAGRRAVVAPGQVDLGGAELPRETYVLGAAPHGWLFPRVAAVISHGGAGTVGAALRAGVPTLGIPFFGDQPFWSRRAYELGAGAPPVPYQQATPERLGAALAALDDPATRRRAAELGQRIRSEDGVARAVAIIGRHAAATGGRIYSDPP